MSNFFVLKWIPVWFIISKCLSTYFTYLCIWDHVKISHARGSCKWEKFKKSCYKTYSQEEYSIDSNTSGHIPKGVHVLLLRYQYTMFIVVLFMVTNKWKQSRYLSTDEWKKKTWYTYTMGFYSDVRKNEICGEMGGLRIVEYLARWLKFKIICSHSYVVLSLYWYKCK